MSKQRERQKKLLSYIKNKDLVNTKGLEEILGCSYPTLCRDLRDLENEKKIIRMHGNIKSIPSSEDTLSARSIACADYYMYQTRTEINVPEKQAIGHAALTLLQPNDTVFITHGTTTTQFAKAMSQDQILTVITDGLDIMNALNNHPSVRLYSTGGIMNYQSMQIEHNPFLSCDISQLNIKKLIMGIGGISLERGITFYDFTSFKFIEQILQQVTEIIVLADHSKLEYSALANFIPVEKITALVTDWNADDIFIRELRNKGIQCIVAENPFPSL